LGAALYIYTFYQRVAPAVMTVELSTDFGLSAAALGNLSAFYFYSYVFMQIPTGILADRIGPRRLLTLGALLGSAGTCLFAVADQGHWAAIGRGMIGGGTAVAFVCMLKLADHWLAPRQYALATGIALFIGIVGAVSAGVPLRLAIDAYGWRDVMLVSAVIPALAAAAIWLLARDDPTERGYLSYGHAPESGSRRPGALSGLAHVLRYRNTWILSLLPGGIVGCVLTFSGLWGVPFLASHYGLTRTGAAALTTTMLVAWAMSAPVFGAWSDRIGRRKSLYVAGSGSLLVLWSVLIFAPDLSIPLLATTLFAIGFASGCMIIGFAFAKESVPRVLSGTVSGVVNMGVMTGPMVLQPAVGAVLDRFGPALAGAQAGASYSLAAYRAGFTLMLAWLAIGFILLLASRETHCRHLAED